MVRGLLGNVEGLMRRIQVPVTGEEFSENRIQRFFDTAAFTLIRKRFHRNQTVRDAYAGLMCHPLR